MSYVWKWKNLLPWENILYICKGVIIIHSKIICIGQHFIKDFYLTKVAKGLFWFVFTQGGAQGLKVVL